MSLRVAILHYTMPPILGGVESIIHAHVRLLRAAGHTVTLVTGRGGRAAAGVHVCRVPDIAVTNPRMQRIEAALAAGVVPSDFEAARAELGTVLAPVLAQQDAVLAHNALTLHFNQPLTAALADLAAGDLHGRLVAWTHDVAAVNPLYQPELHPGYPWDLLSQPLPGVEYVAISHERKRQLEAVWQARGPHPMAAPSDTQSEHGGHATTPRRENSTGTPTIRVIPNGIDASALLRLSEPTRAIVDRFRLLGRDLVLLLPVRITRRKNIELAIDLVASLRAHGVDALLLVTGPIAPHHPSRSRAYLARLEDRAARLGVTDEVIFLAERLGRRLDDRTVADLYGICDMLFLPSQSEGFGLPILEAGIRHIPALVSNLPIFHEVAHDDVTYFELDDPPDRIAEMALAVQAAGPPRLFRRSLATYRWDAIFAQQIAPLLDACSAHSNR